MKKFLSAVLAAALLLTPASALAAGGASEYDDLVTDGYTYGYSADWGMSQFHIPQVNWDGDGIQALNEEIWQTLYQNVLVASGALEAAEEGWSAGVFGMSYQWMVSGDVLSVLVNVDYDADWEDYYVYNVSLSAGRRITDGELLDVLGVEQGDFYELARQALAARFESDYSGFPEDEFKSEQRQENQSDANARAVRPYLDRNGSLAGVGLVRSMAGAEAYYRTMTILGRDRLPETITSADLPLELPVDERLAYFIEHSDSEYLTEADIAGFDEQTCVYARNGVYARSGRKFMDQDLQSFFMQFSWYTPAVEPGDFDAAMLNEYQNQNIALVLAYEEQHGY